MAKTEKTAKKIIYFNIDENKRLIGWSSSKEDGELSAEVDNAHEVLVNPFIFKYIDGKFTKDTAYQDTLIKQKEDMLKRLAITPEQEIQELKLALVELAEMIAGGNLNG